MKQSSKDSIPTAKRLEREFRFKDFWSGLLQTALFLIMLGVTVYLCLQARPVYFLGLFLSLIIYHLLFFLQMKKVMDLGQCRISRAGEEDLGNFNRDELRRILAELTTGKKRVPEFFLAKKDAPTFSVRINLPFTIWSLNAVYISPDILKIMNRDELKAVLAHELGHFYYWNWNNSRHQWLWFMTQAFMTAVLFLTRDFRLILFGSMIIWMLMTFLFSLLSPRDSRTGEYLADLYAAEQVGILPVINSFLAMGTWEEKREAVMREILHFAEKEENLDMQSIPGLMEQVLKKVSDKSVLTPQEISDIIAAEKSAGRVTYQDVQSSPLQNTSKKDMIHEQLKLISTPRSTQSHINWARFDTFLPNQRIEAQEYPAFIQTLQEEPEKMLVGAVMDNASSPLNQDHPSLRQRILFLHQVFSESGKPVR